MTTHTDHLAPIDVRKRIEGLAATANPKLVRYMTTRVSGDAAAVPSLHAAEDAFAGSDFP